VAENQPAGREAREENRMNDAFASITDRIRAFITESSAAPSNGPHFEASVNELALDLYALQLKSVPVYRQFCSRRETRIRTWQDIPALPISAFKQTDVTSLSPSQWQHAFYSSGTTSDERSRHYHDAASLGLYETALIAGFGRHSSEARLLSLTPPASSAPHSSLVHMVETLRRTFGNASSGFLGSVDSLGNWQIAPGLALPALTRAAADAVPVMLIGTAFNFVHLLDHFAANNQRLVLPANSRIMETGGYKGRSRILSRADLYQRIRETLGVPPSHIISEYGMCELSSQGYDDGSVAPRAFQFPPWARFRVVSPEDGKPAPPGQAGILQVFDLANVRSVLAIQTEDVAVSRPNGFELLGRAADAHPRGCSLMTA